jgi:hypothetical protein
MSNRGLIAITAILLTISASALAQSNVPADIKAKMNGYVGTWKFQEETKSSPTSDSVTVTGTWEASWVFDSLIEWRGTFSSSEGTVTTVEYEGYDADRLGYTYYFVSDGSRGELFNGVWTGNTIIFGAIHIDADSTRTRFRCTWPYSKDFSAVVNYSCETLTNGSWWVSRTGNAKKAKSK